MSTAAPGSRSPMSRRRKWAFWALGIFVALLILGALLGEEESADQSSSTTTTEQTDTAPPTTTADEGAAELEEARAAEAREDYDAAIAAYVALGDDDEANRVRGLAAAVVVGRARSAYRAGRYKTAQRQARAAIRKYGSRATGATRVRNQASGKLRAQEQRRVAAREARDAAAAQRRAQARAAREAREAAEAAAAEPEPAPSDDGGSVPSGGTCADTDATNFPVPPGDPRDRDDDGIACES